MLKITNTPQRIQDFFEEFKHIFTVPTYQSFAHLTQAIINNQKKNTITKLHKGISNSKSRTAYSYFFNNAKFNQKNIAQVKANLFFEKHDTHKNKIILSIDDTLTEKEGEKTDGVGKFHDHTEGDYINANNFVTSSLQIDDNYIPHTAKLYTKKEDYTDSEDFKTKIEIAYEKIIKPLKTPKNSTLYVVYDSWWYSSENINNILDLNHHVVCQLKSDKKFYVNGSETSVKEFSKTIEYDRVRTGSGKYYAFEVTVEMSNVGDVKLVYMRKDKDCEYKCIMSTDEGLSTVEIIDMYVDRWNIETVHKEANQKLGFEDYEMRNRKAIERYIQLCFVGWFICILGVFDRECNSNDGSFGLLGKCLDRVRFEYLKETILKILGELSYTKSRRSERVSEVVRSLFWSDCR